MRYARPCRSQVVVTSMQGIAVHTVGAINYPKTFYIVFYFEGGALPNLNDLGDIPEIRAAAQKGFAHPKPGDIFLFRNAFSDPVKRYILIILNAVH